MTYDLSADPAHPVAKRPERRQRMLAASRRSFRPMIDSLERRELMAGHVGASAMSWLMPPNDAPRLRGFVPTAGAGHEARSKSAGRNGVSGLVGSANNLGGQIAPGYLHTQGNQIVDSSGAPVRIVAVNWTGFESSAGVVDGLWNSDPKYNPSQSGGRNYQSMMDQMKALGFNTIRLPLSSDILTSSPRQYSIDYANNPDLKGLTSLQVLEKIVAYAGQIGLKIILDHHQSAPGEQARRNEELWYVRGSNRYTPQAFLNFWTTLATVFKNSPAVIGADLHNEPHGAANWGQGNKNPNEPTDWRLAAQQAGNAILNINSNWLIIVEGVQYYKGSSSCWGTNLEGVKTDPVVLNTPNRVVYSPHAYEFAPPTQNGVVVPSQIEKTWGYIYRDNIAPIFVGEFGLPKGDAPKLTEWYRDFVGYLDKTTGKSPQAGAKGISWAVFNFTPNSSDTQGVLKESPGWNTVNPKVMDELKKIET